MDREAQTILALAVIVWALALVALERIRRR
jgi:hypothetical protein